MRHMTYTQRTIAAAKDSSKAGRREERGQRGGGAIDRKPRQEIAQKQPIWTENESKMRGPVHTASISFGENLIVEPRPNWANLRAVAHSHSTKKNAERDEVQLQEIMCITIVAQCFIIVRMHGNTVF